MVSRYTQIRGFDGRQQGFKAAFQDRRGAAARYTGRDIQKYSRRFVAKGKMVHCRRLAVDVDILCCLGLDLISSRLCRARAKLSPLGLGQPDRA